MKLCLITFSLLAAATAAYSGAPLPNASYLGIAKSMAATSQNGAPTNGGGGAFNGTVSGFATTFWCVDDQLYFALGQSGLANVIGLNQIVADDPRVRYGNVHNGVGTPTWTNQASPLPDSAQERYRMAAYLVSQYDFVTVGDAQSGLQGGASQAKNNAIQNTIWALTNNNTPTWQNPGVTTPDAGWLNAALSNYTTVDMAKWAVVSWTVDSNGVLGTGRYNEENAARQTFLVQVVPEPGFRVVPEPGFYGMLGLGLGGLYLALMKRKKDEQQRSRVD